MCCLISAALCSDDIYSLVLKSKDHTVKKKKVHGGRQIRLRRDVCTRIYNRLYNFVFYSFLLSNINPPELRPPISTPNVQLGSAIADTHGSGSMLPETKDGKMPRCQRRAAMAHRHTAANQITTPKWGRQLKISSWAGWPKLKLTIGLSGRARQQRRNTARKTKHVHGGRQRRWARNS